MLELPADSLRTRQGPLVRASGMLAGERVQKLLAAGFPARFRFRVELWSDGRFLFDQLEAASEWLVLVQYAPIEREYQVVQVQNDQPLSLGRFAALADAERAVARPTRAALPAGRLQREQYYLATLSVEVLSERDIDEVARWLRGDVEPGLTGQASPASIVTRGVRALASRLLGGERLEYEAVSPKFRAR